MPRAEMRMYCVLKVHEVVNDEIVAHNVGDFLAKLVRLTASASGGCRDLDEGSEKLLDAKLAAVEIANCPCGRWPMVPLVHVNFARHVARCRDGFFPLLSSGSRKAAIN